MTVDSEQLWAAATERNRDGAPGWRSGPSAADLAEAHEGYRREDPWEEPISRWVAGNNATGFTTGEVLTSVLHIDPGKQQRREERRVAEVLQRLGFTRRRIACAGVRRMLWVRET